MAVNPMMNAASSAYRKAVQNITDGHTTAAPNDVATSQQIQATGFSDMVRDSLQSAIDIQRNAETVSMQAVAGKADLVEVVNAVSSAEMTLETVVAIRDRVISAYQEIIRMPI